MTSYAVVQGPRLTIRFQHWVVPPAGLYLGWTSDKAVDCGGQNGAPLNSNIWRFLNPLLVKSYGKYSNESPHSGDIRRTFFASLWRDGVLCLYADEREIRRDHCRAPQRRREEWSIDCRDR